MAVESADEFLGRLISEHGVWAEHTGVELDENGLAQRLVEADRNAVRVDLLERLLTHTVPAYELPVVLADVIRAYRDRYAAKEPG